MGIGAYTCGVLYQALVGRPPTPAGAAPAAPPAYLFVAARRPARRTDGRRGGAGWLVGIPTLRLRGDYLAIATLGFGEIIAIVINQIDSIGAFRGRRSPAGCTTSPSSPTSSGSSPGAWSASSPSGGWPTRAKGKAFYAVREDEIAAAAMGVDTTFYKVAAVRDRRVLRRRGRGAVGDAHPEPLARLVQLRALDRDRGDGRAGRVGSASPARSWRPCC